MKRTLIPLAALLSLCVSSWGANGQNTPADNTAKNNGDGSGETQTAQDQSNRPADIKITANIRRAIVKDDSLSITAKNIKIITINGSVILRGPVNTAEEKVKIAKLAKSSAPDATIDNQIEVKTSN